MHTTPFSLCILLEFIEYILQKFYHFSVLNWSRDVVWIIVSLGTLFIINITLSRSWNFMPIHGRNFTRVAVKTLRYVAVKIFTQSHSWNFILSHNQNFMSSRSRNITPLHVESQLKLYAVPQSKLYGMLHSERYAQSQSELYTLYCCTQYITILKILQAGFLFVLLSIYL